MKRITVTVLFGLITLLFILSCAVNPVTGKKEFMLLTQSDELALGKDTDQQVIESYGLYEDPALSAYLNDIGKRMGAITHRPNLNYTFKVLDTPVVNAFAVPGGYVYFTRGILAYFNNEAQLAGVMGHELGHVNARHSAKQYSKSTLANLGLGIGIMLSEDFQKIAGIAQLGVQMLFLKFSRDNEREADKLGVEYSSKIGYDAGEMATFFETLERMSPDSNSTLPEFFSTHPNPVDRQAAVRLQAAKWQARLSPKPQTIHREGYLANIDGIVFGDDPRQGYVADNIFYHPKMTFQFPVPQGWTVSNTPAQVQIVSPQQDAALIFTAAQGSSPSEAASTFATQNGATVISSDAANVHGFAARKVHSFIQSDSQKLQLLSYFIQKDQTVFSFHGLADSTGYDNYRRIFSQTMSGFRKLSDPKKINIKPNHIVLQTIRKQNTLKNILLAAGTDQKDLKSLAVINGLQLDDIIKAGAKVKVIKKG